MQTLSIFKAVFLGVVQGATEFLPVSSSGHLVIFQHLLKINLAAGQLVAFDVALHVGTLLAVILAMKEEIISICRFKTQGRRLAFFLIAGTLPAAVLGLLFKDFFEGLFTSLSYVGFTLICTGLILLLTKLAKKNETNASQMRLWQALTVGFAQALAITPGISRSGSTIAAGLFSRLDRKFAVQFSFLLSIPAIAGAAVLEAENFKYLTQQNLFPTLLGTFAAFIVGYISVKWMIKIVQRQKLFWFAFYCIALGSAVLFFG